MKRPSLSSRLAKKSGFTLIELLVVIGIIAILAAVLFPAGGAAISAAKRAKASATINSIQTAVMAYNTEYSIWPVGTQATPADVLYSDSDNADWPPLIAVLCGNINPADGTTFTASGNQPTNTRAIAFLNFKSSDVYTAKDVTTYTGAVVNAPKNPLPTGTGASATNLYFNIAMDGDYDGIMGTSASTATNGKMPNFSSSSTGTIVMTGTSTAGVALWGNCNGSTTSANPAFYVKTY